MSDQKQWAELVKPIIRKCRLAVTLDMNTTFGVDGSTALADLLEKMAELIDNEIEIRERQL